jgi:hypothetical protein
MRAFHASAALLMLACAMPAAAQNRPAPPADAKAGAPIDLTGQWVSIVTEDWRWRMMTPPKGDYASVPLTDAGKEAAGKWDLAADNAAGLQCKAFGVGGLVRQPGRIRIAWQDGNTLRLESDAGQQQRLFHFVKTGPGDVIPALSQFPDPGERDWQGTTNALWFKQPQSRGLGYGGSPGEGGALRAVTRNMKAGYLRKNGVPYSEQATVTEQYNVFKHPNGDVWLIVTTIVEDPQNLSMPFVTSTQFKKEADPAKWAPTPCRTDPPAEPPVTKAE